MVDLPKFNEFFTPILQVISKTGEINAHEAVDLVVKNVGLNEEQLSLKQESNGRPLAKNRVHWACSYLYKAGGLTRPKRGYIDVGVNTNEFLSLKRPVDLKDIRSTKEWKKYEEEKANRILFDTNNSVKIYSSDDTPEDLKEYNWYSNLFKSMLSNLIPFGIDTFFNSSFTSVFFFLVCFLFLGFSSSIFSSRTFSY